MTYQNTLARLALLGLMGLASGAYAVSASYQTAYSNFQLQSNSLYNIDIPLTINIDPGKGATRFFSEQIAIGPYGAYIGLQTDMQQANGTVGKGALFSIWGASSATAGSAGSWCQNFGDEGTGYSCRIAYPWSAGTTYRLRVWQVTANSWTAYIQDLTSGKEVILGTISLPTANNLLRGNVTTFTEYYGNDFPACSDLKQSQVTWGLPLGDNLNISSAWVSNSIGPGDCASERTSVGTGPTIQSVGA